MLRLRTPSIARSRAGGFVDNAPIVFMDVTKEAGLDKFHHRSGTPGKATIIETLGSGVDYDNDGWLDIFLLNGSTIAALQGKNPRPGPSFAQ
jgi:hypothetical protein